MDGGSSSRIKAARNKVISFYKLKVQPTIKAVRLLISDSKLRSLEIVIGIIILLTLFTILWRKSLWFGSLLAFLGTLLAIYFGVKSDEKRAQDENLKLGLERADNLNRLIEGFFNNLQIIDSAYASFLKVCNRNQNYPLRSLAVALTPPKITNYDFSPIKFSDYCILNQLLSAHYEPVFTSKIGSHNEGLLLDIVRIEAELSPLYEDIAFISSKSAEIIASVEPQNSRMAVRNLDVHEKARNAEFVTRVERFLSEAPQASQYMCRLIETLEKSSKFVIDDETKKHTRIFSPLSMIYGSEVLPDLEKVERCFYCSDNGLDEIVFQALDDDYLFLIESK